MSDKLRVVVFRCETCEHENSVELGVEGFEALQTKFDSLTEAWQHLMERPSSPHYIYAEEQD